MHLRGSLVLSALLAAACQDPAPTLQSFSGPTMGSGYEVKFVAARPLAEVRALVEAELHAFDLAFSNWRSDSEIARCNQHTSTAPFAVSPRFAQVLTLALELAAATDGAFDPTVKPLSDVYRRKKQELAAKPAPAGSDAAAFDAELDAARARVDYRQVAVRDGAVHKLRADVQLDLDGLVAGAAADAIAAQLQAHGVHSYFLQITGEVLAHGEKAAGVPWVVGVVDPGSDVTGGDLALTSLPLVNRSLCTSGDYRNAIVVEGRVRHHVFDPRTGRSTENGVVSASVLAPSAAVADALGTAMMVLGPQRAQELMPRLQAFGPLGLMFLRPDLDSGWRYELIDWPE